MSAPNDVSSRRQLELPLDGGAPGADPPVSGSGTLFWRVVAVSPPLGAAGVAPKVPVLPPVAPVRPARPAQPAQPVGTVGTVADPSRAPREVRPRPDRLTLDLQGLRPRAERLAARERLTLAALVRRAVQRLLDDEWPESSGLDLVEVPVPSVREPPVKLTLRLSAAQVALLVRRARAAGVAQGAYLGALLDGLPLPPRAADHAEAVATLRASTDRMAALSVDLNTFMRLVGRVPQSELEGLRASLAALSHDVRAHLDAASTLLAELAPYRRPPR